MCETHAFVAFQSVACQPKSPYKPVRCVGRRTSSRAGASLCGWAIGRRVLRRRLVWWDGKIGHDVARQFQMRQDPRGRGQDLRVLQPPGGREAWLARNLAPALLDEGAPGKSSAQ